MNNIIFKKIKYFSIALVCLLFPHPARALHEETVNSQPINQKIVQQTLAPAHDSCPSPVRPLPASPPLYCKLENFKKKELTMSQLKIDPTSELATQASFNHLKGFKLGELTLIGVSVGESNPNDLIHLAKTQSSPTLEADLLTSKYCTWYLNSPEKIEEEAELSAEKKAEQLKFNAYATQAQATFHYSPIEFSPKKLQKITDSSKLESSLQDLVTHFDEKIQPAFSNNPPSFLACAQQFKYIALGCNGMNHRGPAVFGMLLAYSGCTATQTSAIVQHYWPIMPSKKKPADPANEELGRTRLFQHAFELGLKSQKTSTALRSILEH